MADRPIAHQFGDAWDAGDVAAVRRIAREHPDVLKKLGGVQYCLRDAARHAKVDMMALMVELGADIHAPDGSGLPPAPEGVILDAVSGGSVEAVRWLLERGVKVNFQLPEFPGESRCIPLTRAARESDLEMVKLLVEKGGANINACWGDLTPLSHALMYGQREIAEYLRSKGALEPHQLSEVAAIKTKLKD